MTIVYKENTATLEQISNHLKWCSNQFVPPLETYVDIALYAQKIHNRAFRVEAWHHQDLAGLVAIYLNDDTGFITNVSVLAAYAGKGLATALLSRTEAIAKQKDCHVIQLEVKKENQKAVQLYDKLGFQIKPDEEKDITGIYLMIKNL